MAMQPRLKSSAMIWQSHSCVRAKTLPESHPLSDFYEKQPMNINTLREMYISSDFFSFEEAILQEV